MIRANQRKWHARSARKRSPQRPRPLAIEYLEDRSTPAAIGWDGGGSDLNWFNPTNWNTDSVPTLTDDVTISGAAGAVTINDPSEVATAGTLSCSGDLSVIAGTLQLAGNSVITGAFTNSSSVSVTGGSLTVGAGSSSGDIQLAGSATMVVTAGFAQPFVLLDGATVAGGELVVNNYLRTGGAVAVDVIRLGGGSSELNVLAGGNLTIKTLHHFGVVSGPGTVTVTDLWNFRVGILRNTALLVTQGLATFGFQSSSIIEGTVEHFGTAIVELGSGSCR